MKKIAVRNRQRALRVPLAALQGFADRAVTECLKIPGKKRGGLKSITELNVILASNPRMAELHRRFLHLPGPTDGITFQHAAIVISVETARTHPHQYGNLVERELCLYIAHELLNPPGSGSQNSDDASE